ncbi:MAG TPA: hypothetical protein PLD25_21795 [Chloroflexota bacterium]|nr:hypothetical protein [Chloroflexota bacterium]
MINWQALIFNSFWIIGLAVLLAACSYQHWAARQTQTSLRVQFAQPSFLIYFWLSFVLVCMGLAGTTRQLWEIAIWAGFAIVGFIFMVRAIVEYRSLRLKTGD